MRRAAFTACDLKFRPVKEKAAASALAALLDPVEVVVVVPEVPLEAAADAAFKELCRLWTDNWRLFARAFSCWRMNCAKDWLGQKVVSQSSYQRTVPVHDMLWRGCLNDAAPTRMK